jgi:hypothetical protein|tara:strand:+ start:68 stop:1174 length:1107 start_codon:yes stop_codon:yes gene_type:complete
MTAHASLGASNAHRWLACAGSVKAESGLPNTSSVFALEGTTAHDLAELTLTTTDGALDLFADREMAEFVRIYTDYVRSLTYTSDVILIEQRVDYSDWVPNGFGTADAIVLNGDTLNVVDLKYGMGVQVYAENNPQGMLYALGAYAEVNHIAEIKNVMITIVQPRLNHISEWSISIEDLLRWAEWVTQRAEATQADDAPREAGEKQCRFCKAKHNCAALLKHTEGVLLTEFDSIGELPNVDMLTDEQMSNVLASKSLIEGWISAISTHATERLETGTGFTGYKLVEGRSTRRWYDDEAAEFRLREMVGADKAIITKVISPTQAQKILGAKRKNEIAEMIVKPAGKPTLVPDSDKRLAINVTASDFGVVE